MLKRLSESCHCAVLTTNQITPDYSVRNGGGADNNQRSSLSRRETLLPSDVMNDRITDEAGDYRPALGSAWYHCVTSRFILQVVGGANRSLPSSIELPESSVGSVERRLKLVKSPFLPEFDMPFWITSGGLEA